MTTKAKPVKAKALPKWLLAELEKADARGVDYVLVGSSVRAILAALKHERGAGFLEGMAAGEQVVR